jgi:signal transduction histidine kinase/ligand-binding sensor domain-containing protein
MRWSAAIFLTLVVSATSAFALNPSLSVHQYGHTSWTLRSGALKGYPRSIAQTVDGYLWLGTDFGLVRFDGVQFVPWQPPAGSKLPSDSILRLLATRDGGLWIGTAHGLARWRRGTLTVIDDLSRDHIGALYEDRAGTVWVGTSVGLEGTAKVCAVTGDRVHCSVADTRLGRFVSALYEDAAGNLWIGAGTGLWRWQPGPPVFYGADSPAPEIHSIIGTGDGHVIAAFSRSLRRVTGDALAVYPVPPEQTELKPTVLLRSRDGGLWIGTQDRGLLHAAGSRIDQFGPTDGLSGELITDLLEDREGNVWVATLNGLDRFHDMAVTTLSRRDGLTSDSVVSVTATADGSVWFGTAKGLNRWKDDVTAPFAVGVPSLVGDIGSLFEDHAGRLWVSSQRGLAVVDHGRAATVEGVPPGFVHAMAEDRDGNLWISNQERGLLRIRDGRVAEIVPWTRFGGRVARALAASRSARGLWLGFFQGGVALFDEGTVQGSYDTAHGLGSGEVASLSLESGRTVWAATRGGLSRIRDGRVTTLNAQHGLPCEAVHATVVDDRGARWLYAACGIVRIAADELAAWVHDPTRRIQVTVYDETDGAPLYSSIGSYSPKATVTADGRMWLATYRGGALIDPHRLPFNAAVPPVTIEGVTADRRQYPTTSLLRLSSPVRDLRIDYTALSLVASGRVRFRYRLDGRDDEWVDAGNRRQAFYTDLAPAQYRFRVIAANNDGVWNEQGAAWTFEILPAYYETRWFRLGSVGLALVMATALVRARMRRVAIDQNMRFEERLAERTRVAQELHDTLLQGFVSASMQLHVLADELPQSPVRAKMDRILEQVRAVIEESRRTVTGLRSHVSSDGLERALARDGEAFRGSRSIDFQVVTEGKRRPLQPIIRDDVYQITREALANAFQHANATHIHVQIEYTPAALRVEVGDNGAGIQAGIVETGRSGHWGIQGMRERAERIGAMLKVWSRVGAGTEVELIIPAGVVFKGKERGRESNAPI